MAREQSLSACPEGTAPVAGPVRTCVGCRERAAKSELLRVVAGTDSHGQPAVVPDPEGTAAGRGAHLHPTGACYDSAVRRRSFTRALRSGVGLAVTPLAEHLTSLTTVTGTTDQDWSSSS